MTSKEENRNESLLEKWQRIIEDFENRFGILKIKADNVRSCKVDLKECLCELEKDIQEIKLHHCEKVRNFRKDTVLICPTCIDSWENAQEKLGGLKDIMNFEKMRCNECRKFDLILNNLKEVFGKPQQEEKQGHKNQWRDKK